MARLPFEILYLLRFIEIHGHIACTHLGHVHMTWVKSFENHELIDELNNLAPTAVVLLCS